MIKIGTSGYSFKDWVGPFYPPGIESGKMLDFYRLHFQTVEINSTYYRIPHPAVFYKIADKTPGDFDYIVKVNKEATHIANRNVNSMESLLLAVKGLIEAGKLKGFLAQFPYSFKTNDVNLEHLKVLKNSCRGFPLFVEFRNETWLKEGVKDFLKENNIGYVDVDEPALQGLIPPQTLVTNGIGYIRFHGRNRNHWWNPSEGDRYDYEYSVAELREWLPLVENIAQCASDTYLFFNNCHMGQAVKNAKMMRDMIRDQLRMDVI
jgi:uncharacterized protein YecE (DUF72 family)